MTKYRYGFLAGLKGKRKSRSTWFGDEFTRNLHAAGAKRAGYRVRKYKKKVV